MADPLWTDATRNDIHEDLGYPLGLGEMARTLEFLLHPQNDKFLIETSDENARTYLTTWRITAGRRTSSGSSSDTDANGDIYWTLTDENPGAGQARLQGFNDSARSVLVTTGSAANGAPITLTAQTGYTLAGTVVLGAPVANFNFRSQLVIPPIKRLLSLFDGTSLDDDQIRAQGEATLRRMRSGAATMRQAAQDLAAFVMRTKVRRNLVAITDQTSLIIPGIRQRSGVVTEEPRGLLEDLRAAQQDNTGGSAAIEAQASTLAGAVSYPTQTWPGGSAVTPTYGQRGQPCVITGVCVKGLDGTAPEFLVTRKLTDTRRAPADGTESEGLSPDRRLRIGANWKAPEWGVESLTIDYLPSISGVTSALLSTTATDWSVTGLTSANSTGGVVYALYESSDTTLRFYSTSAGRTALDADLLVAQVTLATTDDLTTFTTDTNDSGLTIVGETGAGVGNLLIDGSVGDVSFQAPSPSQPSAYFTITVTESTEGGAWVKNLRDGGVGGAGWEPNTGAGLDIVDGQIRACLPLIHPGILGDRE